MTSTKYVNLLLLRGNVKEEVLLFVYKFIYLLENLVQCCTLKNM